MRNIISNQELRRRRKGAASANYTYAAPNRPRRGLYRCLGPNTGGISYYKLHNSTFGTAGLENRRFANSMGRLTHFRIARRGISGAYVFQIACVIYHILYSLGVICKILYTSDNYVGGLKVRQVRIIYLYGPTANPGGAHFGVGDRLLEGLNTAKCHNSTFRYEG